MAKPPAKLEDVRRGDKVRLLVAHYDGYKRIEAGTVVDWWNDTPPDERNACLPEVAETPLTAPPMTSGKPPSGYVDPETGKPPVSQPT